MLAGLVATARLVADAGSTTADGAGGFRQFGRSTINAAPSIASGRVFVWQTVNEWVPGALPQPAQFSTAGRCCDPSAFGPRIDVECEVFHFAGSEPLDGDCAHHGIVGA